MKTIPEETVAKLNRETSQIAWSELQEFYQQDAVIVAAPHVDLVLAAAAMAEDDTVSVARWLKDGGLLKASQAQHEAWLQEEAKVWAVVVAPWVLVQGERAEK
jgi:hypothetical protein